MNIETKLREGSEAIKTSTRQANFSSVSPTQKRNRIDGPMLAWVGGLVVIALFAIPAMLAVVSGDPGNGPEPGATPTTDDQPPTSAAEPPPAESDQVTTTIGFAEDGALAEAGDARDDFPFLFINSSGWTPTYARAVPPEATSGGFAAEIQYEFMTEDATGGVISLRVQEDDRTYERFAELQSFAADQESLTIHGREVTLFDVPREAILDDADSDAYLATWIESSNTQGFAIAFGLDRQELIDALGGLESMPAEAWEELVTFHSPSYQASTIPTTTTGGEGNEVP